MTENNESSTTVFEMSNATYDKVKYLVQIVVPAISALYFGLSQIWPLPAPEEVVGSLALLAVFLGSILGFSAKAYNAAEPGPVGNMVVTETQSGALLYSLELKEAAETLGDRDAVTFKVVHK